MIFDILCFSHLRWNFVYQRPQHLFTRFGRKHRVFFFEEPEFGGFDDHYSVVKIEDTEVWVITPQLNVNNSGTDVSERIQAILDKILKEFSVQNFISWYYTPMALQFSEYLEPELIVYDCMDELSAFKFAPQKLVELEKKLFNAADLIFTGGYSLYEHKKDLHLNIYPFPSSIDVDHFLNSREIEQDPPDQKEIPFPRFGFYGVIDERFDLELLEKIASQKPNWQFVLVGPLAKIDAADLPVNRNIHYLGQKSYDQLPAYLSGWDIAIMPFAKNESTRFISPTKTPEYLAGGKHVISSSISDVVKPYGDLGLVQIADDAATFIEEAEMILSGQVERTAWLKRVDDFLSEISWDKTWHSMYQIMIRTLMKKIFMNPEKKDEAYV